MLKTLMCVSSVAVCWLSGQTYQFRLMDTGLKIWITTLKTYLESVCIVTGGGCWVCLGTGERGQSSAGLRC